MAPFEPKGDRAEWLKIYEALREMEVGDILRYDALDEMLERSFREEGAKRNPLERACRELEKKEHHTLAVVRNVGYRLVAAGEHVGLARTHQKRSGRQILRARERLDSTDLRALTDLERRRHEEYLLSISKLQAGQNRQERRLKRIERLLTGKDPDN